VTWLGPTPATNLVDREHVGGRSKAFIEKMKEALGFRAKGRKLICADDSFELRELLTPYGKANSQDSGNTFLWDQ